MLTGAAALMTLSLTGGFPPVMARDRQPVPPALWLAAASSAAEAAEEARRQTGGRVLAVERSGGGWQVRVLTPSGEVRVIFIPGTGG